MASYFNNIPLLSLLIVITNFELIANEAVPSNQHSFNQKEYKKLNLHHYQQVGNCKLTWLWFDVYQAKFYTITGGYQIDQYPQLLHIQYLRDITAENLIEATIEQWQHLGFSDEDIKKWQQSIRSLWPEINKNDQLSVKALNKNHVVFFYNQTFLNEIISTNFADAFLAIWLSPKTSKPKLRQQLLGIDT